MCAVTYFFHGFVYFFGDIAQGRLRDEALVFCAELREVLLSLENTSSFLINLFVIVAFLDIFRVRWYLFDLIAKEVQLFRPVDDLQVEQFDDLRARFFSSGSDDDIEAFPESPVLHRV